jgi:hypothetical protein
VHIVILVNFKNNLEDVKFGSLIDGCSSECPLTDTQFDKDKHPQCLKDVRVFTERYIKEIQMETREKEILVR